MFICTKLKCIEGRGFAGEELSASGASQNVAEDRHNDPTDCVSLRMRIPFHVMQLSTWSAIATCIKMDACLVDSSAILHATRI